MDRDQTLALSRKGREAWNQWAQDCMDRKDGGDDWRNTARADFSKASIDNLSLSAFILPGASDFRRARVRRGSFDEAEFHENVEFQSISFEEAASFQTTQFYASVNFAGAQFKGPANFAGATCYSSANFSSCRFSQTAFFDHMTFHAQANFEDATFLSRAWFAHAAFHENAEFQRGEYQGLANFADSEFRAGANFNALSAESAFDLGNARFYEVPNFVQAHFLEAPRLDNVQVPTLGEFEGLQASHNPESAPRYRALKRLAILGHDHDRELQFFADELRSLRGQPDQLLPNPLNLFSGKPFWPGGARYWFGLAYEVFSNFGRSISRPVVLLGVATALFAEAYYALRKQQDQPFCAWSKFSEAFYVAARKALIIPGLGSDARLDKAYACLYGTTTLSDGGRPIPSIPDSVAYLGIVQTMLSGVLIFLFLLAVRNHFRIK